MKRFSIKWSDTLAADNELVGIATVDEFTSADVRQPGKSYSFTISIKDDSLSMSAGEGKVLLNMTEEENQILTEVIYAYYDGFIRRNTIYFWTGR